MLEQDVVYIFTWWLTIFLIGVVFFPIAVLFFSRFLDRGYIFSKILGMLFITYTIFALGTLKIMPFTHTAIIFLLFAFGVISVFTFVKDQPWSRLILRNIPWKLLIFEETLFLAGISFWAFIRAHEPSIHGLEKFMDFAFVNSILRTDYFPAKDLWLTPLTINYYYFGHIVTAVLTKLSGLDPVVTYNLMIATLFAFTFTCAFSIGANLINQFKIQNSKFKITSQNLKVPLIGGLLAGFLVAFAGNLHTIYAFFTAYNGENPVPFWTLAWDLNLTDYWYPNATRFIPFTIHEFPIYSFVVSDLHGHVLSIPIVLTIIAVLLSLIFKSTNQQINKSTNLMIGNWKLVVIGLLAGYASILVSNFFGFSVVVVNLFFFLIPALVFVLNGQLDPKQSFVLQVPSKTIRITNYEL